MTPATFPLDRADTPLFADGLGERVLAADASTGELLQVLRLRPELTAVPSFEFALRERAARLTNFRHAYYARVRRVDRLTGGGGLAIVSDHVEGTRLSDVLRVAHQRGLQLDTNAALCLIRQLVPAVSLLHENARDASHGLIAPERLVVAHARLVIVEHVLGSGSNSCSSRAIVCGRSSASRSRRRPAWRGSIIVPTSTASASPRCRWCSGGHCRRRSAACGPAALMQARERTAMGEERPLSNAFRNWLGAPCSSTFVARSRLRRRRSPPSRRRSRATDLCRRAGRAGKLPGAIPGGLTAPSAPLPFSIVPPPVSAPSARPAGTPPAVAPAAPFSMTPPMPPPFAAAPVAPAPNPPAPTPPAPTPPAPAASASVSPRRRRCHRHRPRRRSRSRRSCGCGSRLRHRRRLQRRPRGAAQGPPSTSVPTLAELISLGSRAATSAGRDFLDQPVPEPLRQSAPPERRASFDDDTLDFDAFSPFSSLDDSLAGTPPAGSFRPRARAEPPVPTCRAARDGRRARPRRVKLIAAVAASAALIGGGVYASRIYGGSAVPEMGTLNVQSSPAGVEVFVDGVSRGMTPARVSVAAGSHILELRGRGVPRVIPLQVPAGGQFSSTGIRRYADHRHARGALAASGRERLDGTPWRGADHDRRAVERRSRSHASEPRGRHGAP